MLNNQWIVLVAALVLWSIYFHAIDWAIMEAQGLPVGLDLMPR